MTSSQPVALAILIATAIEHNFTDAADIAALGDTDEAGLVNHIVACVGSWQHVADMAPARKTTIAAFDAYTKIRLGL